MGSGSDNVKMTSHLWSTSTLGSRYPNCSDTETPPWVIRYPNKFYPNYLVLGVSVSEQFGYRDPPKIEMLPKTVKWLFLSF